MDDEIKDYLKNIESKILDREIKANYCQFHLVKYSRQ